METTITQISDVEYELEIREDTTAIDERIDQQLKKLRPAVQMKGFRPGKVPMGMVKKLHGKAVAYEVVDELIQEAYQSSVLNAEEHDVLGSPTVTKIDYEPYGDLLAQIQFGVRPDFQLAKISGTKVTRLTHDVNDEEVDREIDRLLASKAKYEPVDGPAEDDHFVRVNLHELDSDSDTPIIGSREEGVMFDLNADGLDESVKGALKGKGVGDVARFTITHSGAHHHDHDHAGDHDHDHDHDHSHDHRYEATIIEVQQRVLPEATDDFASEVTDGRIGSLDELKSDIETRLRSDWDRALRDKLEDDIVRKLVELHDFDVPPSVVELYLDSQVEDVKQRSNGQLPQGFDVQYFRDQNRPEAERMARWMLIRDKIIDLNDIQVESDDLDHAFDDMGSEDAPSGSVRRFVEQSYPGVVERMEKRLESKKVFDWLIGEFDIKEEPWVDERA